MLIGQDFNSVCWGNEHGITYISYGTKLCRCFAVPREQNRATTAKLSFCPAECSAKKRSNIPNVSIECPSGY